MTRSRRKTPIFPMTTAETDKPYKQAEHKRERRKVAVALRVGEDLPARRMFGNPWASAKDGRQWWPGGKMGK